MQKEEFSKLVRDRFAERYHKQIGYINIMQLIDCMVDVCIFALKRDRELKIRNFLHLRVTEPREYMGYNSFTGEYQPMTFRSRVIARMGKNILNSIKDE